ncbi:unnamed protein product [Bursaphelenchus okinawaensis]|uniref:ShKT domain-containing protein n=1 Tax=Bursaphelenchus okinawaensis TaxID=465554 RepID=A0A811K405_9BILA|nr:unnamed protein product [Bursaphelenchus okinawaensis]CAG9091323.1 unnamed protein product [Bursaphelenchus okinawaensis]
MNRVRLRTLPCTHLQLVLLVLSPLLSTAQFFDCQTAPGEPWRTICQSLVNWDVSARQFQQQQAQLQQNRVVAAPAVPDQPWLSPAVPQQMATQPQGCMDLGCLCSFLQGLRGPNNQCQLRSGGTLQKAVRREIRTLSDGERQRLFQIMQQLKNSGQYDSMSGEHRAVGSSSGAHSGPGFLPWHREFMKRFEISLRLIDPNMALPYWDSVMDSYLPRPADSIFFSPIFMGEADAFGQVVTGPFSGWRTLEGKAYIQRSLAREGRLFNENDLNNVYRQTQIEQVMAYTVPERSCPYQPNFGALEYTHSSVHLFIGGDMKPPVTSANDPVFFFHHSFVDLIFENWRQMRQNRWAREQAYPPDIPQCANQQHFSGATMRPYQISNRQGLSNAYTDNLYQFAERPNCNNNCGGSKYLFCDNRGNPHCVSKVKMNGLCQGFEGFDVCYQGLCRGGVCVPGQFQTQQDLQNPQTTQSTAIPRTTQASRSTPRPSLITAATQRAAATITRAPNLNLNALATNGPNNRAQARRRFRRPRPRVAAAPPSISPAMFRQPPPPMFNSNVAVMPARRRFKQIRQRSPRDFHNREKRKVEIDAVTMLEDNLRNPIKPAANMTLATEHCFNDDPCCNSWAKKQECAANPAYMKLYCQRACGVCHSNTPEGHGCRDRHIACATYKAEGRCSSYRQFMATNCRRTCGWCNVSERQLCQHVAMMSRM